MAYVALSVDQGRIDEVKRLLSHIPKGAETAIARALNKSLEGARKEAIQRINQRYAINPNYLRDRKFRIQKASPGKLVAHIISSSPKVPVGKFVIRPEFPISQKGIPVKKRKKATSEMLRGHVHTWSHGFVAEMKSGHVGIFTRKEKSRKITERMGPSLSHMLGHESVINAVLDRAREMLETELERQVRLLLAKGGGR